jgi:hypothetical protein
VAGIPNGEGGEMKKTRLVSLSDLKESGLNELIYHPIRSDDPEIVTLADSIRKNGLLKNLVISKDGYILDGHRRRAACQLAGVEAVRCEVKPVTKDDPRFMVLLREYNRQRVKGVDEIINEQSIDALNAEEEIAQDLMVERIRRSRVSPPFMSIEGNKRRAEVKGRRSILDAALKIIHELEEFWPLSVRQIHYQFLNNPPLKCNGKPELYANDRDSYSCLSDVLTRGRLSGEVPWESINDDTRPMCVWTVHPDITPFVRKQFDNFMKGYFRDYLQSQPNHIEIVGEKLTIQGTIRPVAMKYCVPYTIGRGFSSVPPRYEMAKRFRQSGKKGLIVLMVSDMDPDGDEISHSFARSMRDDFKIDIHPIRVAINDDQVSSLNLNSNGKAKAGSKNYDKFKQRHNGNDDVYELEAIPPKKLQDILTKTIEAVLDTNLFNSEVRIEEEEFRKLAHYKRTVMGALGSWK